LSSPEAPDDAEAAENALCAAFFQGQEQEHEQDWGTQPAAKRARATRGADRVRSEPAQAQREPPLTRELPPDEAEYLNCTLKMLAVYDANQARIAALLVDRRKFLAHATPMRDTLTLIQQRRNASNLVEEPKHRALWRAIGKQAEQMDEEIERVGGVKHHVA
jgi:hypothetical protein